MATIDQIQIPSGTYDIMVKSFYGTCSTAAATAAKVVTLSNTVGWNLVPGVIVGVKFTYNNSATSVTLNVNGSGAKSIYYANAVYTGTAAQITGLKDCIIYYMYDGTNWVFLNQSANYIDTDSRVGQTATTTSANYEVLFSATADNTTRTEGARKNSNLLFNPSTGNLQATQLNGVTIGSSPKFTDTNTWRGIQNNLTSDSATDSLAAAQGKALANGSARDNSKEFSYKVGSLSASSRKVQISINAATSWMLSFVVTLYTSYRATKVMISGYNYGDTYWYSPKAVILGDSSESTITVYFGYTSKWNLWVGFDGGQYTGVSITDVTNGYTQISDLGSLFTIDTNVSTFTGTVQETASAINPYTDTTYESKAAASGGTAVSLVTTGEKYTWNNKSNLTIGTTATTAAAGNHTHTTSIAASSGTNQLTLAASTKYALTAGGTSYIFTTPPNTTYSSKAAASGGTDVSLVTTGEKYTWNNKSNLTIGTTATTAAAGNHTHNISIAASSGTNQLSLRAGGKYALTAGGKSFIFTAPKGIASSDLFTQASSATNMPVHSYYYNTSTGRLIIRLDPDDLGDTSRLWITMYSEDDSMVSFETSVALIPFETFEASSGLSPMSSSEWHVPKNAIYSSGDDEVIVLFNGIYTLYSYIKKLISSSNPTSTLKSYYDSMGGAFFIYVTK
jgi:hypothetical protein